MVIIVVMLPIISRVFQMPLSLVTDEINSTKELYTY